MDKKDELSNQAKVCGQLGKKMSKDFKQNWGKGIFLRISSYPWLIINAAIFWDYEQNFIEDFEHIAVSQIVINLLLIFFVI